MRGVEVDVRNGLIKVCKQPPQYHWALVMRRSQRPQALADPQERERDAERWRERERAGLINTPLIISPM